MEVHMDEHKPELSEIVSRMERIEKENRRLKRAALVVMLVAGVIVLVGAARPTPDIIRAQKFVVVNARGKEQVVLEARALKLYDDEGVKRVDLGADSGQQAGAGLFLYDQHGKPMVDLSVPGLPGSATLAIFDGKGNERADIGVFVGTAALGVYGDTNEKSGAKLEAVGDSSSLQVYGPGNRTLAELNTSSTEVSLYLSDNKGYGAVVGNGGLVPLISNAPRGNQQSAASLVLFGKDKKVLWSAP
jgi:hypothetical protein